MRSSIFSSSILLLSAVLVSTAVGTPVADYRGGTGGKCKNPIQRKEWLIPALAPNLSPTSRPAAVAFFGWHFLITNSYTLTRRALSDGEKKSYIDAVKCLQKKPPITAHISPGAVSRFDDFQGVHISLAWTIHYVVSFSSVNPGHAFL